jgi:hypothetical protein
MWLRAPVFAILLEESELLRIQEMHKDRQKTKIWFGVGTVARLIIGIVS